MILYADTSEVLIADGTRLHVYPVSRIRAAIAAHFEYFGQIVIRPKRKRKEKAMKATA